MIRHLTYSDKNMTISGARCIESALQFGCDSSVLFRESNISESFKTLHDNILSQPRGAGYWLWKPLFILQELNNAKDGDYVVYTDAGILFEADIRHVIDEMDSDIMVFGNRWRHGDWCKADVLEVMEITDLDTEQLQASCIILHKSQEAIEFIEEWLEWCCIPGMIDDSESKIPNQTGFREHRHDQAILTNVSIKHELTWHWWPAQYSLRYKHQYDNNYGVTFMHHRYRNNDYE